MDAFDQPLGLFRDALLQASFFGETEALRAFDFAARGDVTVASVRRVLDAAAGSVYLPRLERTHVNVWVPA